MREHRRPERVSNKIEKEVCERKKEGRPNRTFLHLRLNLMILIGLILISQIFEYFFFSGFLFYFIFILFFYFSSFIFGLVALWFCWPFNKSLLLVNTKAGHEQCPENMKTAPKNPERRNNFEFFFLFLTNG